MAQGVEFPEANVVLSAPSGMEDQVVPLSVYRDGDRCVSCWQLSAEERAEIERTGRIWLSVWAGRTQPPVLVTGLKSDVIDAATTLSRN